MEDIQISLAALWIAVMLAQSDAAMTGAVSQTIYAWRLAEVN